MGYSDDEENVPVSTAEVKVPRIAFPPQEHTLWSACYFGNEQLAEEFIAEDPECILDIDEHGKTPLHYSLARSSIRTASVVLSVPLEEQCTIYKDKLLELSKRSHKMGRSMVNEEDLRLCEQWLNEERSRYASEFQAQCCQVTFDMLCIMDNNGLAPLHYAATTRDNTLSNIVQLWSTFAQSHIQFRDNKRAFGAGSAADENSLANRLMKHENSVVKRKTKKIALKNVNVKDKNGNTPLHYAAASGSNSALRLLVSLGADKMIRNKNGQTPTELAKDRFCRMALMQMAEAADAAIDQRSPVDINEGDESGDESGSTKDSVKSVSKMRTMKSLIDRGEDVNGVSSIQSNTALHRAAIRGQVDVTETLLKSGADVEQTNCNGWTPLHCCAYFSSRDHRSVAAALLDADADIDARTLRKRTALHICVLQLNVDSSTPKPAAKPNKTLKQSSEKWLRAQWGSYDENTRSNQRCPQRKIRQSKEISDSVIGMIGLLIRSGCRIDAKDGDGKTALHHAAEYGNPRTVFELIQLGADLYATCKRGFTALHYAATRGNDEVVLLLVKLDCEDRKLKMMRNCAHQRPFDVASTRRTREAMINLWEACEDGQLERVRGYLSNVPSIGRNDPGAVTGEEVLSALKPWMPVTVREKTRKSKRSCLHLVAIGAGVARSDIANKLKSKRRIDRGVNSDKFSKNLKQKLSNFKLLTKLLLSKGASANEKDQYGATPLMYAAQGGICSMMKILFRDGDADLEIRDKYGNTAMHYAIAYSQIAAANFLEDQGADALALNDNDESPTDVAAIRKDLLPHLSKKAMRRFAASRKSAKKKKSRKSDDDDDYDDDYEDDGDQTEDGYSSYSSSANDTKARTKSKSATKKLTDIAKDVDRKKKSSSLKDIADEVDEEESQEKPTKPSRPSKRKGKPVENAKPPSGRPGGRPAGRPGGRPGRGGRPKPSS